jgi:cytochrome c oxidase subunit 3
MSSEALAAGQHEGSHAGHHGHHDPNLQHHFSEMAQQFDASKIGMWLFLATEILLFGGLFVGYGLMQAKHPEAFKSAHHHLDWRLGGLNTIILLVSSFTMVMGVWSAQTNRIAALKNYLLATLACAGGFMVVKFFEYSAKIQHGTLPGMFYNSHEPHLPHEFVFFSFYFMMTGLHGIHVLGGMVAITWLYIRASKGDFSSSFYTPVDLVGLYWHLVDLIWIYLFPLFYLIS